MLRLLRALFDGLLLRCPRCATLALGTLKAAITLYRNNKIRADLDADRPAA